MFKIVVTRGGLGNQMFSYSFYLSIKYKYKHSFIELNPVLCYSVHTGFELPQVFPNIKLNKSYKYYRRFEKICTHYPTKHLFKLVSENGPGNYCPELTNNYYPFLIYDGFWQTEKYFQKIENEIRLSFHFDETKLNFRTKRLARILEEENSISVHIRRGDYVGSHEFEGICDLSYYKKAINIIEKSVPKPKYFIFTDDKEWVTENFLISNYSLIDWNISSENWQDMYLMTKCKHNIIANSSFSWWGAWLNTNKERIVISPAKWFKTLGANDIVPETWIRI